MPSSLLVRDLPDDVVRVLEQRAADHAVSLNTYLLGLLSRAASRPSVADMMARAARRPERSPISSTATLRAERDARSVWPIDDQ